MPEETYEEALARVTEAQWQARKRSARLSAEAASLMDMTPPDPDEPPLTNVREEADRG